MRNVSIITPPDYLYHDATEVLLLYPSDAMKNKVQEQLVKIDSDINIYIFDQEVLTQDDLDWLLNVFKKVEIAIIDLDFVIPEVRPLLSYMIAKPKTFWLTNGENLVYNTLSSNRVNDFEFLTTLGGQFE
mgnify:CR=1 FL=1